jgi:DNA modification methylase
MDKPAGDSQTIQPECADYVQIAITIDRELNESELKAIDDIQREFPTNGFYFKIDGRSVCLFLKSIDLSAVKQKVQAITSGNTDIDTWIFEELINRIEGIKSYGIKGGKRIYGDYNKERKVVNRQKKAKKRGNYYYALDNKFSTAVNEIPNNYVNKILCGDSEDLLKKLPSNSVDLIFTSPPYNFGLEYDTGMDEAHWETYFDKLFAIFKECIRVTKYGGRIVVNVQPLFSDYIPIHHIISNFFMENKLIWKGEILWEKNNYNCKYTAWGSWKSPSSPYLKYTWEFVEVFCKGDLAKTGDKDNIDITADEFKKWVYAKWSISPERNMKKYNHPAMFPEELVDRVLKLFSYQNDIILDPFNGVGTTTAVAKKLHRRYIGIDISDTYCKCAEKRLKEILSTN